MKKFKFTIRGHAYDVEIVKFENGQAEVEVNGTPYQVEIQKTAKETKTPVLVRPDVKHPKDSHKIKRQEEKTFQVKAPLPGIIMSVIAQKGDTVKKGEKLLIYEAMKMENNLLSEKNGIVKKVNVNAGDSVLEGDVLMEIE